MPVSRLKKIKQRTLEESVKLLLGSLGYNLKDQDLRDTPKRVAKLLINELTPQDNLKKIFSTFQHGEDVMVILDGHDTYSRCPHHLERVILKIWIGYISEDRYIGVSKLARIADYFSKGLMLQEEIVSGIAEGLTKALEPKGVAVVAKGRHMCMTSRGVKSHAPVIVSKMTGLFLHDSHAGIAAREEFLSLINKERR